METGPATEVEASWKAVLKAHHVDAKAYLERKPHKRKEEYRQSYNIRDYIQLNDAMKLWPGFRKPEHTSR